MAEVVGLVFGSITLASLFRTCIELCEYIEEGKNILDEVRLASAKVRLLRMRLHQCASVLENDPLISGSRCGSISQQGETKTNTESTLEDGFSHIARILNETRLLSDRYKLAGKPCLATYSCSAGRQRDQAYKYKTVWNPMVFCNEITKPPQLRKRLSWALWDKKKFDSYITHLDFLIQNLEKLRKNHSIDSVPSSCSLTDLSKKDCITAMCQGKGEGCSEKGSETGRIAGHSFTNGDTKTSNVFQGDIGARQGEGARTGASHQFQNTKIESSFLFQGYQSHQVVLDTVNAILNKPLSRTPEVRKDLTGKGG